MGLDMYLIKRTYVKKYPVTVKLNGKIMPKCVIDPAKVTYIEQEVATWRKANHIHNWFVQNVQDGEDDCKDYCVSREDLKALLSDVNKVLGASKLVDGKITNGYTFKDGKQTPNIEDGKNIDDPTVAKELLPTTSGLFFGGTEYDEYYYRNCEYTRDVLTEALEDEHAEFQYGSSW